MVGQPIITLQPEPIVAEVIIPELDVNEETDINNLNGPPAPANAGKEEGKKESADVIQRTRIEDYEVLLPMTRITLAKWMELIGEEISVQEVSAKLKSTLSYGD
jgi:hypothetical protein